MNYLDIKHCNMVNGLGLRTVIWLSGCDHKCKGCFQEFSWDKNAGVLFDDKAKEELFKDLNEDWCDGITFTGGDPLFCSNRKEVIALAMEIKEKFPTKTIWLYTGFCWNDILSDESIIKIINYVDVICDGPFVESLRDIKLHWVGSSNQHVIDVKQRLQKISQIAKEAI